MHDFMIQNSSSKDLWTEILEKGATYSEQSDNSSLRLTILKIFILITGIFFSLVCATSLPPNLAFVSITLIVSCVFAVIIGAQKIIHFFPKNVWIWKMDYPSKLNSFTYEISPSTPPYKQNYSSATTYVPPPSSYGFLPPSSHSTKGAIHVAPGGGHVQEGPFTPVSSNLKTPNRSSSFLLFNPFVPKEDKSPPSSTSINVPVGGGHDNRTVGFRGNVVVGSRESDP